MYKIVIEVDETELRIKPGTGAILPLKISGWNFEDKELLCELESGLKDFILDFVKGFRRDASK